MPSGPLSELADRPLTLVDLLRWRLQQQPDHLAYAFLRDGETQEINLTYEDLDRQAQAIAERLRDFGTEAERVLLLYSPGLDFVASFFGCLYAGKIAVPAYPPDPARLNRSLPRLQAIVKDAQAKIVLTDTGILSMSKFAFTQAPELETLNWIATDAIVGGASAGWDRPDVKSDDIAFLQYTSGSTGTPKGVMLSHSNLLHNASLVYNAVEHTSRDRYVSWLPMFHDMGFMAGVLQPLYAGIPAILMSPVSFLQSPIRWLQAISRYKATTSGGPNFAYDLCVRKVSPESLPALDLSSWSVAFNGAEPIRAETLERFATTFEPCGFRRQTFFPCYGLAEATLIISGGLKTALPAIKSLQPDALKSSRVIETGNEASDAHLLVGCGNILGDQKVAIVDPDSLKRCPSGEVGEIWVSGESIAKGYWNYPEQTESSFQAYISETGEGPFLRTGDLGFLQDGELFITGRLKDLIIIRGLNHYPQDIELTVERCHLSLKPGCGAAFSIEAEDQEQLVVVQEIDINKEADLDLVVNKIRKAVAESHELQLYAIALIKPGSIPKTSSGKIQRRACKAAFLENSLSEVTKWQQSAASPFEDEDTPASIPTSPLRTHDEVRFWLVSLLESATGVSANEIDVDQPITMYGLDSLMAIEMMHSIESRLSVSLPMASLLQGCSISELALQVLAQSAQSDHTASVALRRSSVPIDQYSLSHGQRGLWFLQQIAPDSVAYNIARAARVLGQVDTISMRRAFESLVNRHPSLRSTFSSSDSEPVQQIHERIDLIFQHEDASGWNESLLNERLAEETDRPFDLARGPLLRINLFTRSEREHILLLVVHHIVTDFWSLAVFLQEFGLLYRGEVTGTQASLPHLPLQYTDHVSNQADMLSGVEGERLWSFWEKQLAGYSPVLDFPLDHLRPAIQTYSGDSLPFEIDEELTLKVRSLARARGATLYATLLAAFQALLYRYTAQTDFLVGSPTAGRGRAEYAGIIGYFINAIVLRADLSNDPTFEEFLDRARNTVLSALEHQEYPLPLLVERLQPARDPSRSPLFQVMFALQKTHLLNEELLSFALGETGMRVESGGLFLEPLEMRQRVAQFDFTLAVAEIGGRLCASLEYNTDILDRSTIARLAGHFQTLIRSIVQEPQTRVSQLPLFSEPERDQLLFESNDVKALYCADTSLDRLFSSQVMRAPHAEALCFEGVSLTYAELDIRANQLAHFLRSKGAGPEELIGICMDRSVEMVVSLLAVLKSSGAFLPLDPTYPRQRLAFMLEDARVKLVLTERKYVELLSEHIEPTCVERDWDLICTFSRSTPETTINPQNLAYVIYTSGTTGTPKGTMIPHEAAVNSLLWFNQRHEDDAFKRVVHKSSLSFDVSVWEIFWPLISGGAVVVARPGGQYDTAYLARLLDDRQVSITNFPPAMLRRMIEEKALQHCASLRYVACGGEAVPADLINDFLNSASARLENFYGPTETTISSAFWECSALPDRRVLIGTPYGNTRIYILDENLQPVPVGVLGQIHIAGLSLARGYLGRPDLTADKFIPDPFNPTPGARLYKTGDLGRHTSDYNIEYIARIDQQVKLRGYRIELDEIQHVLRNHPEVSDCVVIVREDEVTGKHLVGYVVAAKGKNPAAGELRSFLKQSVPDYMLPSAFVFLDDLPLTPNGKLDQSALPAPTQLRAELHEDFCAPRTETEEVIAGVWADVLKTGPVSITNNFFNLGGHSLLAAQVIFKLRNVFQIDLPVHEIFETPTVEGLARRIQTAAQHHVAPIISQVVPTGRDGEIPLSFAQLRMWILNSLDPDSPVYNIPVAARLKGSLNVQAVERGLNEIIRRHEILRTHFAISNGHPIQIIDPELTLYLPVIDLTHLPESNRRDEVTRLATEEGREPFDLSNVPLLRVKLLRVAEEDHVFLLTMHHIISDGWSLGVFLREFATLYEAFGNDGASPLAELPIQYADFANWQRQWLQGEALEALLAYWKQQLSGGLTVLDLPSDYPRPPVKTFKGKTIPIQLSASLSDELHELSRRENVTLFMTLLSAFNVLLHRYTRQRDLLVGIPIAGRNRDGVEGLIGCFINTLVARMDLSGNPSFREILLQARDVCSAAQAHQDLPFERLVDELEIERNLSRNPLFQVMFELQTEMTPVLSMSNQTVTFMDVERNTSKFDLTLNLIQTTSSQLSGYVEYSTDLFEAATIERFAKHFETLLDAVVKDQSQDISSLPLLSDSELNQLLCEWNDARTDPPNDLCIHHLFEVQAESTPHSVAVVFEGDSLTYGELESRANQLARHLRQLGVAEEARVGICLERSLNMVVAMLAVLKAGGAYVPLDPSHPADWLAFLLEDSQASVLLTQQRLIQSIPDHNVKLVCLDVDWSFIAGYADVRLPANTTGESLVYVLYTSGSSGRPKGVAVEHRQLVNYVEAVKERLNLDSVKNFALASTFAADLGNTVIFPSLTTGGCLHIISAETLSDADEMYEYFRDHSIDCLKIVPSHLASLRSFSNSQQVLPRKVLVLGGEASQSEWAKHLQELDPGCVIFNHYGPTEATVGVLTYQLDKRLPDYVMTLPLGRPLKNTQTYILDENLQPVPVGVAAEILIGGAGLARGYFNRPDLTAEKFVPHPFSDARGARLYRTGDLARYLPDGNIEFLGRIDNQVKVRGFRIEPGEIESALRQHAGVREAVVVAIGEANHDKRIVAYAVADRQSDVQVTGLRSFLKDRLPDHMIPSSFVMLDSLPLTSNGKVDRRALPSPDFGSTVLDQDAQSSHNPIEEVIVNVWAQVLGLERVGVKENFFELGGNSLLATQAISRLRAALQPGLALRSLFESPTVVALADYIRRQRTEGRQLPVPIIKKLSRDTMMPLSYSQWRLWFFDQLVPDNSIYNVAVALRLNGPLDANILEQSMNEIVRRHEVLRTTFPKKNNQPVQLIAQELSLNMPVVDLAHLEEFERENIVLEMANEEAARPFNLAAGPLLRMKLLRLGHQEHVLLLVIHHIVCDDWSVGIFNRELSAFYTSFLNGVPPSLPDLSIQYSDFACWQQQWLSGETLQAEINHWKSRLGENVPVLEIPTDHPRPDVQKFRGANVPFELDSSLSEALKAISLQEGSTLFMILLAAFAALLHRYSGQERFRVGIPIANRNHSETEGLIGFFTNVLVLLMDVSGNPSYKEMLGRVREVTLDAYDHQDMPFEKLVEAFQLKRDLSRAALRQVAFAYEQASPERLNLPDISVSRLPIDSTTARLDMTLFMSEDRGKLKGSLEYNSDLFERATVLRFLGLYQSVLEDMVSGLERPILALPLPVEPHGEMGLIEGGENKTRSHKGTEDPPDFIYTRSNMAASQLLFWFSKKLRPDVRLYFDNVIIKFSIKGEIDREHFQNSFQKMIDSSDALRSFILEVEGLPRRGVRETLPFTVNYVDFSESENPSAASEEWLQAQYESPFDFEERLFDCALLKIARGQFIWFLKISHIISDLWSVYVILNNVSAYYELSLEGNLQSAAPVRPYQDYIEEEHTYRLSSSYDRAEEYWKHKLSEAPNLCRFYRTDLSNETTLTERLSYNLGVEQSGRIREIVNRGGLVSPAIVFAAALFAYQYRLTGEETLRIGSPLAYRPDEFRQTVGLFINVCPLQVTTGEHDSFLSLARKVQLELIDSVRNQQYSVRTPVEGRIFNVYFNYQIASFTEFSGMPLEFNLIQNRHSNDTLALQVRDFDGTQSFVFDFDFNCEAFNEWQRQASMKHYLRLLEAFIDNEGQSPRNVGMLSDLEQRQILFGFNETKADYFTGVCLHQLFEAQAELTPNSIAVVYDDQQLTYSELNQRANQLAHFLGPLGVKPDVCVGVCMERSVEMVVGLLGVLKAGGAYVPIDPAYPKDRLAFMLADAGAPVLLTQSKLAPQLAEYNSRIICVDTEWENISRASQMNPDVETHDETLAYMIYTSGSTGKPKGATIPHRGICNRLLWMQEAYQLTEADRVLQKTPFSFDVSVWEFFWPLITGARLVVARPGGHQDRAYLIDEVFKQGITTIHFVPSMLRVFLAGNGLDKCGSLKRVICSGEALPYDLQQSFFESLAAGLYNLYGPTEASVDVTAWKCLRDDSLKVVPIGYPIANTQMYILDKHLNPLPLSIPGELYIGGTGLARGYHGRPELTAERFIPNPFGDERGARLYKTGDLARYASDGSIEFLGRSDYQVKLRGFRIELGEIEDALARHPSVREVVVLSREDRRGHQRLVAYVVPAAGHMVFAGDLRDSLKESLPEYMIPSAFVPLQEMPLTPSGKLNRRALPEPEQAQAGSENAYEAPRSPLERLLADIWVEVLAVEKAGINDDFFEMGGQSILATQFISRVQQVLPVELPLRAIFERPTIAGLADFILQRQPEQDLDQEYALAELFAEIQGLSDEDVKEMLRSEQVESSEEALDPHE